MVAGRPLRMSALPPFLALAACQGLDRVPLFDGTACAPDRVVEVACVLDGDTFQVGTCGGESIRMLGINAPEIAHEGNEAECYGDASAEWLTEKLTGQTVTLRFDETCTDVYDRTLAYVYLTTEDGEEELVNGTSLREGQSRVYEDFSDIKLIDVLRSEQDQAQREAAGLWGECE